MLEEGSFTMNRLGSILGMSPKGIVRTIAILALFLSIWTRPTMSQTQGLSPSIMPENEVELQSDPPFVATCMARIENDAEKLGWRFGNSILTRSDNWGLVWRVDFHTKSEPADSTSVNRVVCWRRPSEDGIAVAFFFG